MPISVAVADSQYLIRVGLMHLLNSRKEVNVVGEAANKNSLYRLLQSKQPDVLIFDYNKPDTFDKEDLEKVRNLSPKTGILIISADDNRQSIYDVLEKGVNSFLTKECDEDEIFKAIQATSRGEKFFCSKVLDFLLQKSFGTEPKGCHAIPLTMREVEIVKLVAGGKTAKEISEEINISTHTIYTHRKNIMKKLKMNSTSELVLYAVRHGLVD
ncbi:MAG: DNA-binding NarL/FixJ family response regulator [Maribacter sp.]|jgi:DNA-binding NarL/FixJ family response regulator